MPQEAVVGGAVINYRADARQLITETRKATNALRSFQRSQESVAKALRRAAVDVTKAVAGFATFAGLTRLQGSVRNIADVGAEIAKQARSVRLSGNEFESFANVLRGEGISESRFVKSLNKIEIAIQRDSTALRQLGTSVEELSALESPLDRFLLIVDRLRQTGNTAAASTIVGERDIEILQRLSNLSAEAVQEAFDTQRAIAFAEGTAEALERISQDFTDLDTVIRKSWGDAVAREEKRIIRSITAIEKAFGEFIEFTERNLDLIFGIFRLIGQYLGGRFILYILGLGGVKVGTAFRVLIGWLAGTTTAARGATLAMGALNLAVRLFRRLTGIAIAIAIFEGLVFATGKIRENWDAIQNSAVGRGIKLFRDYIVQAWEAVRSILENWGILNSRTGTSQTAPGTNVTVDVDIDEESIASGIVKGVNDGLEGAVLALKENPFTKTYQDQLIEQLIPRDIDANPEARARFKELAQSIASQTDILGDELGNNRQAFTGVILDAIARAQNITQGFESMFQGLTPEDQEIERMRLFLNIFEQHLRNLSQSIEQERERRRIVAETAEEQERIVERLAELRDESLRLIQQNTVEGALLLPEYQAITAETDKLIERAKDWGIEIGKLATQIDGIKSDLTDLETLAAFEPIRGNVLLGLQDIARTSDQAYGQIRNLVNNTFDSLEDSFVRFVETGKTSFSGLIRSIGADITRLASRRIFGQLIGNLLGSFGFNTGGSFIGQTSFNTGNTFHQGGIVTRSRGLRSDEVPIIAQVGERILPRGAQQPGISVQLNNYGTRQEIIGQEVSMDALGRRVVSLVIDDYNRGGRVRDMVRQGAL